MIIRSLLPSSIQPISTAIHKFQPSISVQCATSTRAFFDPRKLLHVDPLGLNERKVFSEKKVLNYSQRQMYDLVRSVEHYHQFVPYCQGSKVLSSTTIPNPIQPNAKITKMKATLTVGFNSFTETYLSEVTCKDEHFVEAVASQTNLFNHLITTWKFTPKGPHQCLVDFHIDFQFKNPLYAQASQFFFDKVCAEMMEAFVKRADVVYNNNRRRH